MAVQTKSGPVHYSKLENIGKSELIKTMKKESSLALHKKKELPSLLDSIINTIKDNLILKRDVRLLRVGFLCIYKCKPRTGRNIPLGEPVEIPSRKAVKLRKHAIKAEADVFEFGEMISTLKVLHPKLKREELNEIYRLFLKSIASVTKGETRIEIRGLGCFIPSYKAPRESRNPRTGEKITTKGKYSIYFKASPSLLKAIN